MDIDEASARELDAGKVCDAPHEGKIVGKLDGKYDGSGVFG